MLEQAFNAIDDALRSEAGCATEILDEIAALDAESAAVLGNNLERLKE